MSRSIGASEPVRVAIADDSGLIFSDDYRSGWVDGFKAIGCSVEVFDISILRGTQVSSFSPYRSRRMPGTAKDVGRNIAQWRPDLVFCHHGRAASNQDFLSQLHKVGARTAVYLCDEPYEIGETARYSPRFGYVFTMDPETVEVHRLSREDRKHVFYLPPGVETHRFAYRDYSKRNVPAFFLGNGTLVPRADWLRPIDRLVEGAKICYLRPNVAKGKKEWIPFKDHASHYSSCIVGLNVHRSSWMNEMCWKRRVAGRNDQAMPWPKGLKKPVGPPRKWGTGFWNDGNLPASHVNPRFLEMASCGTLVVNDNHRSELARMFPMAPQAQDPDHFAELVLYYLKHSREAEAIGRACSTLISRRHSYAHRAAEVLIRVGLKGSARGELPSFLGEPEVWLSQQDFELRKTSLSSDPTGPCGRWSPAFGMSSISESGRKSEAISLDAPTPWLS